MEVVIILSLELYRLNSGKDLLENKTRVERFNNISNFIQKWLTVDNLNFLIGSGCSFPAVPLMNHTFMDLRKEDVEKEHYNSVTFEPFYEFKKEQLDKEGFLNEEIEDKLNKTINIEEYLDWLNQAINYNQYTNKSVAEKFKNTFNHTLDGIVNSMSADPNKYSSDKQYEEALNIYREFYQLIFERRIRKQKIGNVNIYTPNYDLFNEIALEKNRIHYTTGFKGGVHKVFTPSMFKLRLVDDEHRYKDRWDPVRRFIKLYKIHGSLNWYQNEDGEIIQLDNNENEENDKRDRRMIYPYMAKHNLTRQSPYSELFREFSINMQRSNSVLFIMGYGFPDEHINQIIKQGLDNPELTIIIFGDIEEENLKKFYKESNEPPNLHIIGGEKNENPKKRVGHHFHNVIRYFGGGYNGG